MTSPKRGPFFVDTVGGGLAALAAGVARSLGHAGAVAATTRDTIHVPPEVAVVLAEIGASPPAVIHAADLKDEATPRVDPATPGVALYPGAGEFERCAVARIARDRIERRLDRGGRID
jgi:hypothetical protein